jgi:hypothetical protein
MEGIDMDAQTRARLKAAGFVETNVQELFGLTPERKRETPMKYYGFVGECGIRELEHGGDEQYLFELNLGMAFVLHILGQPPDGGIIGIQWWEYGDIDGNISKFPEITLEFDRLTPALEVYEAESSVVLERFHQAVNWAALARPAILKEFQERKSTEPPHDASG